MALGSLNKAEDRQLKINLVVKTFRTFGKKEHGSLCQ